MTQAIQSIRGYAAFTIAMSACVSPASASASAGIVEVRQVVRGADSAAVRYPRQGGRPTDYIVVKGCEDWPVISPIDQPEKVKAYTSFDDMFADISSVEVDKIASDIRRDLGKTKDGEVATLQQLRLKAGLSQIQLAKLLKSNQAYVSKLESGAISDPSLSRAGNLARALGVSLELIEQALSKFNKSTEDA